MMPLHNKLDKTETENYREIALLDMTYKILAVTIRNRLQTYAEEKMWNQKKPFSCRSSFYIKIITDNLLRI